MTKSTQLIITVAAALALAGCSKTPPANLPPPPTTTQDSLAETSQNGISPGSQAAFLAEMGGRETIYFDTELQY